MVWEYRDKNCFNWVHFCYKGQTFTLVLAGKGNLQAHGTEEFKGTQVWLEPSPQMRLSGIHHAPSLSSAFVRVGFTPRQPLSSWRPSAASAEKSTLLAQYSNKVPGWSLIGQSHVSTPEPIMCPPLNQLCVLGPMTQEAGRLHICTCCPCPLECPLLHLSICIS